MFVFKERREERDSSNIILYVVVCDYSDG